MLYTITIPEVEQVREELITSLAARATREKEKNTYEAKEYLFQDAAKRLRNADAYTLAYFKHFGDKMIPAMFERSKAAGSYFDSKTFDLVLICARALNGSVLADERVKAKAEYMRAYVLALESGMRATKALGFAIGDAVRQRNPRWHADSRWGSACLGVLQVLGVVAPNREGNAVTIANMQSLARLAEASRFVTATGQHDAQAERLALAAPVGNNDDNEDIPVPEELLALPAPDSDDCELIAGEIIDAAHAADLEASRYMFSPKLLTAPAAPPAKARKARKAK